MKNCSLFLPTNDLNSIAENLVAAFPKAKVDKVANEQNWTQITLTLKTGWFGKSSIVFSLTHADNLAETASVVEGMVNWISDINTPNNHLKQDLIAHLNSTKVHLGVFADTSFELFEDGIYQFIGKVNGLIFKDGAAWVNGDKKLIINILGQSDFAPASTQNEETPTLQPRATTPPLSQSISA